MNLDSIIKENLNVLFNLKLNDKLKTVDNRLIIDNEENEFQELNSPNLELVILNTLSLSFQLEVDNLTEKDELLNLINISIDNVYDNEYLQNLLKIEGNEERYNYFYACLKKINRVYKHFRNKYQKNKCNRFFFKLNDYMESVLNETIFICKVIIATFNSVRFP